MAVPSVIQMAKRIHASKGNDDIKYTHTITPIIGTNGTNGVLKGRGLSGSVLRNNNTPIQTNEKANKVPIDTMWPKSVTGTKPAKILTKTMKNKLVLKGVLNLE